MTREGADDAATQQELLQKYAIFLINRFIDSSPLYVHRLNLVFTIQERARESARESARGLSAHKYNNPQIHGDVVL